MSSEVPREKILGIPRDWRFELTKYPIVRSILKSRWMPLIAILVNLFIFTVILMAGVVGGVSAGNYNFGITFVWIVWWVLLMMIMVPFFSRVWCLGCPLPAFGEWLQRRGFIGVRNKLFGLNKRWPKKFRNMWLMNFLFLGVTFTTGFITTRPIATFILLMAIIGVAIILSMVYEKRVFCLYLCPVSGFLGLYSNIAMTEIRRKDPEVCRKHKIKECVLGNEKGYACPWLEQPFKMSRNTYCGMCLECFKTCKFDNMALNLRPPGVDLLVDKKRGLDEAWKAFIMLGIAISFTTIMQGPWGFLKDWANAKTLEGYLMFITSHSILSLLLIPAIFLGFVLVSKAFSGNKEVPLKKVFVNFSYTLVPLGLMAWVAFSFGILLPNGSYVLHVISDPFAWGWDLFGTAHIPWTPVLTGVMPTLKSIALIFGLILSIDIGYKISKQTYASNKEALKGSYPIFIFLTLATIFLIWLNIG
ncbi:MAG: 4Fe-4S binding protein [Methanosarcinales archaeon]